MKFVATLIAVLTALAGCAEPPLEFDIDAAFAPAERAAIILAADDWNSRTRPEARITFRPGGPWTITKAAYGALGHPAVTGHNAHFIRMEPCDDLTSVRLYAAHEFGHVLGLEHVEDGIMAGTTAGLWPVFTDSTMAECRRVGACD